MELLSEFKGLNLICEFLIKSSLVLVFSFLLVFLFRKKSSSLRHFLLSFSLICLLLIPFFSSITKGWETRLLPTWQTGKNSSLTLEEWNKNKEIPTQLSSKGKVIDKKTPQTSNSENTKIQNRKPFISKISDTKSFIGSGLIIIWATGLIFLLIRIFLGLYGAHRLTRQGKRISSSLWQQLLHRFLEAISIKRKINLLSHKHVKAPLTWGVVKPVVIIPAESRNWTKDQCSSALFHELSHIKRSDFLIKILAGCSCALYWFNPLSWFAFRMMKSEQEKACDELVLKAGVKPSTYAANLLSIKKAGQIHWNPPAAVLGAVGKSQLNERLVAILKQQLKPKEVKMKTKILLSSLVITAIALIGLARPSQSASFIEKSISDKDPIIIKSQNSPQEKAVQEKQEKKKSKKVEKKESKDKKKEITCVSKGGESVHLSINICKDDEVEKVIIVGKPHILLKKGSLEKGYIFSTCGKDLKLKLGKGEKSHWTIKEGKLLLSKDDKTKVINLGKDDCITIKVEKGKDGKNILLLKSPEVHLKKYDKLDKNITIHIEGEKGEKKKMLFSPDVDLHVIPHVEVLPMIHLELEHKELKEKIKKIREKLKNIIEQKMQEDEVRIQEVTLKEIEEVLEELSEKLEEKSEKLKDINVRIKTDLKNVHIEKIKDIIKDKIKMDHTFIEIEKDTKVISVVDKDEGFQVIIKSNLDSENKSKYEEILKKLKKNLPESYKVKSDIDEKAGTITIKITGVKKDKESKKKVKKLIQDVTDELSIIFKEKH